MVTSVNSLVKDMVDSLHDEKVFACALPEITGGGHPREEQHQTNGYYLAATIVNALRLEPDL